MGEPIISSVPVTDLLSQLSSSENGLSAPLAEARMKAQAVSLREESRFKKELRLFIRQFTSPLVFLLVIAVVLSSILGESSDSLIILTILLTTGIFGFFQEANAGRAMEKLRGIIEMKHAVLREGKLVQLTGREIVPGDIILLEPGDIVPADCRIIECNELHVNEATITGESFPVEKTAGEFGETKQISEKPNCLWQGTSIVSGTAKVVAVQTGRQTLFGQMAHSLQQTTETAFEKGIKRFGYFLLKITVILSTLILIANLYFKRSLFDSVLFSLALAVGMAPELLPAIMTFGMSAGAKRMMKKKVIVKKLSSIFNFGEVNILCTDKTGTITEGTVVLKGILDIAGNTNDQIRQYAFLNASLQNGFTNPIDLAISKLDLGLKEYEKINEVPYDFFRRRLSVACRKDQHRFIVTKGAFKNILEICTQVQSTDGNIQHIDEGLLQKMNEQYISWSNEGYRVLGLASRDLALESEKMCREDEQQMTFLGYILLEDPLKESAKASVDRLRQQDISVKIITGDNKYVAMRAAQQIDIYESNVLTGEEMESLSTEALTVRANETNVFAEIQPHQKERIIKALQHSNLTIAYIGDGINDVAAINAADIGISTSNAVDVAKEAADFVFLEKDLSVLADGVYEGRKSFANSMKYIFISTGAIFGNMFSVAGASLFLPFLPMLPKQILLTNLLSDIPYLTIASDHVDEEQLKAPGKWNLKLIRNFMVTFGFHSSVFDFVTFYLLFTYFHLSNSGFQTGWFLESVITELLILYVIRTRKSFFKSKPARLLTVASLLAFLVTVSLPFSPFASALGLCKLELTQLLAIAVVLIAYFFSADILKLAFFKLQDRKAKNGVGPKSVNIRT